MSTDRELLELAAKAAGLEWYGIFGDDECECIYFDIGPDDVVEWNPLTDDGDALRLAVKLDLTVMSGAARDCSGRLTLDQTQDDLEATRRAIVRAAAEIGKGL